MSKVVDYIIRFLLHGNDDLANRVGYTSNVERFNDYDVVIFPSVFFADGIYGTSKSEPKLPLAEIEGVPLLFGEPKIEKIGQTLVVYADIVASAFFLLSRYEEMLHLHDFRDEHGRFIGKKSLPARAGFIHRPIVDEYGALLRSWLRQTGAKVAEPKSEISAIYLTHDVDTIAHYRRLRGFLGGVKRALFSKKSDSLKTIFCSLWRLENDSAYTFPWLIEQDKKVPNARKIYFLKSAVKSAKFDYPQYDLCGRDAQKLVALLREHNCEIGLHASYFSGANPEIISEEKKRLQKSLNQDITLNRWHYLRTLQFDDFSGLISAGITEDFTMAYADVAGFHLGTCRAVHWLNPKTLAVTDLVLHPLTAMDCTLSNENYMNLSENEASDYVEKLIEQTRKHAGEVVLLWHNQIFASSYHKSLYLSLLKKLG